MFPNHLNFYFNYKISGDTSGFSHHLMISIKIRQMLKEYYSTQIALTMKMVFGICWKINVLKPMVMLNGLSVM